MCEKQTYFKHFCGSSGKDCDCHGHHSRSRPCLNASCGKEFKSSCGAQIFCSLQCQLQTNVGREMFRLLDGDRILREKKEHRRRQVRKAVQRFKKTPRGIEVNRKANARYRAKLKARASAAAAEGGMCW